MAQQPFDAFLPSEAIEEAYPPVFDSRSALISSLAMPPGNFSDYIPARLQGGRRGSPKPYSCAPSTSRVSSQSKNGPPLSQQRFTRHQTGRPLSPPFSRSPSAEEDSRAAQIQGWRIYTQHLRENAQGERAHMEADRARMEEVMAEERALWDQERDFLKGQIADLETQLAAVLGHRSSRQGQLSSTTSPTSGDTPENGPRSHPHHIHKITSVTTGITGTSAKMIPQESGRNPDGSPFYAPAPRNPSRTFEASQNTDLRVDSMSAPRETPLCITSKELTEADFGVQPPLVEITSREGSVESIDISYLQPELDGVPIKTSAVAPAFVAKVLSPNSSLSPSKPSPQLASPLPRRELVKNQEGLQRSGSQNRKVSTLEVITAPEDRRLTMNAGHTPNHSIHKFDLGEDSGNVTPTQNQHGAHSPSMAHTDPEQHMRHVDEIIDPDPELRGPLGLKNDAPKDEIFLIALTNKLKEVKESGELSLSEAFADNGVSKVLSNSMAVNALVENKEPAAVFESDEDDSKQSVDEAPILRVKASMNFGRPFGSL